MKLFSPRTHGYVDYLFDLVFFTAPSIFGFTEIPTNLCYLVASFHLVMNLVTQYPLGLMRWMRFSTHGKVEVCAAVMLALLPWLAGFSADVSATPFFVLNGFALFLVWLTTNYQDVSVAADTLDLGVRPYTTIKHPGDVIDISNRQAS